MGSEGDSESMAINQAESNLFSKVKPFCSVILSEAKEQKTGTVILSGAKDLAFCIYSKGRHTAMFNSKQSRSFASLRKTMDSGCVRSEVNSKHRMTMESGCVRSEGTANSPGPSLRSGRQWRVVACATRSLDFHFPPWR